MLVAGRSAGISRWSAVSRSAATAMATAAAVAVAVERWGRRVPGSRSGRPAATRGRNRRTDGQSQAEGELRRRVRPLHRGYPDPADGPDDRQRAEAGALAGDRVDGEQFLAVALITVGAVELAVA